MSFHGASKYNKRASAEGRKEPQRRNKKYSNSAILTNLILLH